MFIFFREVVIWASEILLVELVVLSNYYDCFCMRDLCSINKYFIGSAEARSSRENLDNIPLEQPQIEWQATADDINVVDPALD